MLGRADILYLALFVIIPANFFARELYPANFFLFPTTTTTAAAFLFGELLQHKNTLWSGVYSSLTCTLLVIHAIYDRQSAIETLVVCGGWMDSAKQSLEHEFYFLENCDDGRLCSLYAIALLGALLRGTEQVVRSLGDWQRQAGNTIEWKSVQVWSGTRRDAGWC